MEFQFGKNPEYTVHFENDFEYWALPICIYWCSHGGEAAKNIYFSVRILCFYFGLEVWKWTEK